MKCGSKIKISELVWVRDGGGGTPTKNKLRRNAQNGEQRTTTNYLVQLHLGTLSCHRWGSWLPSAIAERAA